MPSNLHQLELSYIPLEDRFLLKFYTKDMSEFRFWLTRRFVCALWDVLMKLLETDQKSELQRNQEIQKVSEAFNEEQAKKQPTAQKFATHMTKTPFGPEPLLASCIMAKPVEKELFALKLEGKTGESIEIMANSYIIFSLCKLIHETIKKADWKLDLQY